MKKVKDLLLEMMYDCFAEYYPDNIDGWYYELDELNKNKSKYTKSSYCA